MNNSCSGIYKITNCVTDVCYIGSAQNLFRRWKEHQASLKRNKHHSIYLQRVYNKHGADQFKWEVLLYCENKDLLFYEQRAIDLYKPGYNINLTAGSRLGMPCTEQTKQKISNANKGKPSHNKGKSLSDEQKAKISATLSSLQKGKKRGKYNKNKL